MADSERDRRFFAALLETFKAEAREHVAELGARHDELAVADPVARAAAIEIAFREAHSLKAAARAVGNEPIEVVCRAMESAFAEHKRSRACPAPMVIAALRDATDGIADLLSSLDHGGSGADAERAAELADALDRAMGARPAAETDARAPALEAGLERRPEPSAVAPSRAAAAAAAAATIRLPVSRLESLMRQGEGLIQAKLAARAQVQKLAELSQHQAQWDREWQRANEALRTLAGGSAPMLADGVPLDARMHALDAVRRFLDWSVATVRANGTGLAAVAKGAQVHSRELASKVDGLLRDVKLTLLMQCSTLFDALQRTVRALAAEQGKRIHVTLEGGDLELDRRVLDALREPLLHLVRNCVDHGIETPDRRAAAGKTPEATLRIAVTQRDGDKAEITVSDDGAGIVAANVAASAVRLGLLRPEQAAELGPAAAASLIFASGLSTSAMLTDVSGRGLGLAIVREKVEGLGGLIEVDSTEGVGTSFRMVVPLSLTTFRGVCVRVAGRLFVIPTLGLDRVYAIERGKVLTVENRPVLWIERAPVPLIPLAEILELPPTTGAKVSAKLSAIVLGVRERRVAFEVDAIDGDEEILVKPLGSYLVRVRNVLGATVLGSGEVAPILNVHDLLKSAALERRAPRQESAAHVADAGSPSRILVVEDSITARMLLKTILEASGHAVKTAVDGLDAWTLLNLEDFDLVISDVEMPRMNGFDLTTRIRADQRLAAMPVALLTALASRDDRERGVAVGANAYIAKGDFDQQRLLDIVRRLA